MKPAFLIQSAFAALAGTLLGAGLAVPYPKPAPVSVPERTVIQSATPAANDDAAPVPNEPATVSDEATTALAQDAVKPEAVSLNSCTNPKCNCANCAFGCGGNCKCDRYPLVSLGQPQESFTEPQPIPAQPAVQYQPIAAPRTYYVPRTTYGRYYQSCGPNGCGPAYGGRRLFRRW